MYRRVAVMFAYEQCQLCLGHHPDVWIEAAAYVEQASKLLSEKGVCFSFMCTGTGISFFYLVGIEMS